MRLSGGGALSEGIMGGDGNQAKAGNATRRVACGSTRRLSSPNRRRRHAQYTTMNTRDSTNHWYIYLCKAEYRCTIVGISNRPKCQHAPPKAVPITRPFAAASLIPPPLRRCCFPKNSRESTTRSRISSARGSRTSRPGVCTILCRPPADASVRVAVIDCPSVSVGVSEYVDSIGLMGGELVLPVADGGSANILRER